MKPYMIKRVLIIFIVLMVLVSLEYTSTESLLLNVPLSENLLGTTNINRGKIRAIYEEYEYNASHTSDYLFDQDSLHRYDLFIDEDKLQFLDEEPVREIFVDGALLFENQLVSYVGIRYKGEHGSFEGYVENFQAGTPATSGAKIASKLSIKVKIDYKDENQQFYGVKTLQFHSMNNDPSMMRERLYWQLLSDFGVPAPRCVHVKLYINGVYAGIFNLTEQIDEQFAEEHFQDGNGNIYKVAWPIMGDNTLTPEAYLMSALKTNEDEPDVSHFQEFGMSIIKAESMNSLIEHWFDIDQLRRLYIVMNTLGHSDSLALGGCSTGICPNGNFYWYVEPLRDRVYIIPWDMDIEFRGYEYIHQEFDNDLENDESEYDYVDNEINEDEMSREDYDDMEETDLGEQYSRDKLTEAIRSYFEGEEVEQLYEQFLSTYYNSAYIDALLDKWSLQIQDAIIEAATLYDDVPSLEQQQEAVQFIKDIIISFDKNNPPGAVW